MHTNQLFHISEDAGITTFKPRPSPSHFNDIKGDVVFAVSERMLHNYLLPRNCPRVSFHAAPTSSAADKDRFLGASPTGFVLAIEAGWLQAVQQTILYCYEMPPDSFLLLDKCAGYYISYETIKPLAVTTISNPLQELAKRSIELRVLPQLHSLANEVSRSSLNFSLIRMINATNIII